MLQVQKSISEVRSLLGMANYSSKYIPNFATTALHSPNAFRQLTNVVASAPCMAYFDKQKETLVTVDASPVGVSAILSQNTKGMDDEKIVACASRALTDVVIIPKRRRKVLLSFTE